MSVLKKRRNMPVDEVCEDSFFANLLLGLPKTLKSLGIEHIKIRRYPPCTAYEFSQWEKCNGVKLPQDLEEFYRACNGFLSFWAVTDPEHETEKTVSGKIEINSLVYLQPIPKNEAIIINEQGIKLGFDSKIFSLEPIDGNGNVVLFYRKIRHPPTIWFCNRSFKLYFLANDFTTYMRMAIAHLGVFQWQMAYAGLETSETSSELFRLYLPHYSTGNNKDFQHDHDEELNTIDSSYMLNLKTHCLDSSPEKCCLSSTVPTKKTAKINSPRPKSKYPQKKRK